MTTQDCEHNCVLIDSFGRTEKALMRIGFYGSLIVGAYAIYSASLPWGLLYTGLAVPGLFFAALHCFCAHCPYPYQYSDCLFFPPWLVSRLHKSRPQPMSALDKTVSVIVMGWLFLVPQYWLLKNPVLLVPFWALCLPVLARMALHVCRRSRYFHCPLNRVSRDLVKSLVEQN